MLARFEFHHSKSFYRGINGYYLGGPFPHSYADASHLSLKFQCIYKHLQQHDTYLR